jgi:hypothetical protein
MSERWWMTSHEFNTLVSRHLRLRWGLLLLLLLLLNGDQSLTDHASELIWQILQHKKRV